MLKLTFKIIAIGIAVGFFACPGMGMSKESAKLLDKALADSTKELRQLKSNRETKTRAKFTAKSREEMPTTESR